MPKQRKKKMKRARRPISRVEMEGGGPEGSIKVDVGKLKPYARRRYETVIEATIDEMGFEGFEATPVARILEVSGASRAFFYSHFGNREAAFYAAYEIAIERMAKVLAESVDDGMSWEERVRAGLDGLLAAASKRPALVRFLLVEPIVVGPWAVSNHRRHLARLVPLLDAGRGDLSLGGELPAQAGTIAIGSAATLLVEESRGKRRPRLRKLAPDLYFLLLMPYLGPAAAAEASARQYGASSGS